MGRRPVVELGAEDALAGEVEIAAVLEHGSRHDLPHLLALEAEPRDQPIEGRGQHVLVGNLAVRTVGPGEGDPVAAEDGGLLGRVAHSQKRYCSRPWPTVT